MSPVNWLTAKPPRWRSTQTKDNKLNYWVFGSGVKEEAVVSSERLRPAACGEFKLMYVFSKSKQCFNGLIIDLKSEINQSHNANAG